MKLKFLTRRSDDLYSDYVSSYINQLFSYSKYVELLHYQLVRKGRASFFPISINVDTPDIPSALRELIQKHGVVCLDHYNIKYDNRYPYDRYHYCKLGLNQLFLGMSPYKPLPPDADQPTDHDTADIVGTWLTLNGVKANVSLRFRVHAQGRSTYTNNVIVPNGTIIKNTNDTVIHIRRDGKEFLTHRPDGTTPYNIVKDCHRDGWLGWNCTYRITNISDFIVNTKISDTEYKSVFTDPISGDTYEYIHKISANIAHLNIINYLNKYPIIQCQIIGMQFNIDYNDTVFTKRFGSLIGEFSIPDNHGSTSRYKLYSKGILIPVVNNTLFDTVPEGVSRLWYGSSPAKVTSHPEPGDTSIDIKIKTIPLYINNNTKTPIMGHVTFVEYWNNFFEFHISDNKKRRWWHVLVKPISFVLTVVAIVVYVIPGLQAFGAALQAGASFLDALAVAGAGMIGSGATATTAEVFGAYATTVLAIEAIAITYTVFSPLKALTEPIIPQPIKSAAKEVPQRTKIVYTDVRSMSMIDNSQFDMLRLCRV